MLQPCSEHYQLRERIVTVEGKINGNGGRGILPRLDDCECDIERLQEGKLDKTTYEKDRGSGVDEKRLNIMIAGIILSSFFSAGTLTVAIVALL